MSERVTRAMEKSVTPVEERIDHAQKRRAELIVEDVDDREAHGNITAFQREARGVARDYIDLLTEHSARDYWAARDRVSDWLCGEGYNDLDAQSLLASWFPGTESAQPEQTITNALGTWTLDDEPPTPGDVPPPTQPEEERRG